MEVPGKARWSKVTRSRWRTFCRNGSDNSFIENGINIATFFFGGFQEFSFQAGRSYYSYKIGVK